MTSAQFAIFERSEKILTLDRNIIAYGLVFIGLICYFLPISINETLRIFYILITCFIFVYFLLTSIYSYEPLNGVINGELKFNSESIVINDRKFKLNQLSDLYLYYEDYFGERRFPTRGDLNQTLLQGVRNYIYFCDESNTAYKYHFRINSREEAMSLASFLEIYNNHPNSLK